MITSSVAVARKDRLLHEQVHDPYKTKRKPSEPSICPVCNAIFKDGRWQWLRPWSAKLQRERCQACQRIRDNYPAGLVTITGSYVKNHKAEVLNLIRNLEAAERAQHALNRVMTVEEQPDKVVVSTTDIHLPKRIGEALRRAYKGRLNLRYSKEGCFLRVNWCSDP